MIERSRSDVARSPVAFGVLASLGLAVASCGGGGGGNLASTPPGAVAVTPTPNPTPTGAVVLSTSLERIAPLTRAGLTSGTYDTKAVTFEEAGTAKSSTLLKPGDIRLGIDGDRKIYTLTIAVAGFTYAQNFDLAHTGLLGGESNFGYRIRQTDRLSDGSTRVSESDVDQGSCCLSSKSFSLSIRPSYVSLGSWSEPLPPNAPASSSRLVYFAQGVRTEPGDIPARGTASYEVRYGLPLILRTDFEARSVSATLNQPALQADGDGGPDQTGFAATGLSLIAPSGDFLIPLSGRFTSPNGSDYGVLTGAIDGAFFGPQAAEAGGVYQLLRNGNPWQAGAFAAIKFGP